jgi:hypothetical protein
MSVAMTISPLEFFSHLKWIDDRPLLDIIELYRQRIFTEALHTFDADGRPHYNLALTGRGKKNWKSADLILAALYRFLAWDSPQGNDCFLLANDEGQAGDDLKLLKKVIAVNPLLDREVIVKQKEIERLDAKGTLKILPAQDAIGAHGKTYLFVGFDEIHGYRNWDIFEALAPDPTRLDALTWITSYASIYNSPGAPLFDLMAQGKRGEDPRMFFSWYSSEYCTDPHYADAEPEARANPSMPSWGNPGYLAQQRRRLPSHKFRRLHLNLPGMPDGAFLDAARVMDAVVEGRKVLRPVEGVEYSAFVDMSGGSSDDAALGIAHFDAARNRAVLDLIATQTGTPPFNPRNAVGKFAGILRGYGISAVIGDRYAGETFVQDFFEHGVSYRLSVLTKSQIYEAIEPRINAGELELLDVSRLTEQLLGLVARGTKIDHLLVDHDDLANAAAGAVSLCLSVTPITADSFAQGVISFGRPDMEEHRTLWGQFQ